MRGRGRSLLKRQLHYRYLSLCQATRTLARLHMMAHCGQRWLNPSGCHLALCVALGVWAPMACGHRHPPSGTTGKLSMPRGVLQSELSVLLRLQQPQQHTPSALSAAVGGGVAGGTLEWVAVSSSTPHTITMVLEGAHVSVVLSSLPHPLASTSGKGVS